MSTAEIIWKELSQIDVSAHTEKKGNLTYLSWAWAWATLMKHYPEATYAFEEPVSQADGTMMVSCTLTIDQTSRRMWLPVMDNRNKPVQNPDSFAINTAMMRCLTKCISMFGLGIHIYAGSDLPVAEVDKQEEKISDQQRDELAELILATGTDMNKFCKHYKVQVLPDLTVKQFSHAMTALAKKEKSK